MNRSLPRSMWCYLAAAGGLALVAPSAAAAACRTVRIDSMVKVNGAVHAGVPVKAGTDWDLLEDAMGIDPDGAVTMKSDSQGRIQGQFQHCDDDPPPLLFKLRSDFHEDTKEFAESSANFDFRREMNFDGEGVTDYVDPPPETRIKFRFPVADRSVINHAQHLQGGLYFDPIAGLSSYLLAGPFGLDHRHPPRSGKTSCIDYDDRGSTWGIGLPWCYGKHDGTDYMLVDGFDAMDDANFVVAAADGYVEDVVDGEFDRCRLALAPSDNDAFDVTCYGHNGNASGSGSFRKNYVTIDHGFDHWDPKRNVTNPRYAVKTRYLHLKKHSVRNHGVKKGDFVSCGQIIGEIGSSGNSSAPHLHFDVQHLGQHVDPNKGKLSAQGYWTDQTTSFRELPGVQCQDPSQRYMNTTYQASLEVSPPVDLGILSRTPLGAPYPGKTRWWRVRAKIPAETLVGFNAQLARVKWRLPAVAVVNALTLSDRIGDRVEFYVPIANARDPNLSLYTFDVVADVTQDKLTAGVQTSHKFKRVEIPRPSLALTVDAQATKVVDRIPRCGAAQPVYEVDWRVKASGLLGATPTIDRKAKASGSGQPIGASPVQVCSSDGAEVTFTATDGEGVESVTATRTLRAPRFVLGEKVKPDLFAASTPVTIPPAHAGDPPFETRVFSTVRATVDPHDHGGEPLPHATPKPPVSITWSDAKYYDRASRSWVAFGLGPSRAKVTAAVEKGKLTGDTLVLTFADSSWPTLFSVKVTVTDGYGRTLAHELRGANGKLPPPATPRGLRDLLFVAGFQIDQGDPAPLDRGGLPVGDPQRATVNGLLQRLVTAQARKDRAALTLVRRELKTLRQALVRAPGPTTAPGR